MSGRTDSASRVINAAPAVLYRALTDPTALMQWLPPAGMVGEVDAFDATPGGEYRMTLRYLDQSDAALGKSDADRDIIAGRFIEFVPDARVVQEVLFESDDPAFAGTMRITWSFEPVPAGTLVTIRCDDVPSGIRKEDHDTGLASSLENLAAFVA